MIFKIENKHINCKKTLFIRLIPDCVARDVVGVYVDVEEVEVGDGVEAHRPQNGRHLSLADVPSVSCGVEGVCLGKI